MYYLSKQYDDYIELNREKLVYENEELLREIHANSYNGTDDDMPDAFDNWLCNLDITDLQLMINSK